MSLHRNRGEIATRFIEIRFDGCVEGKFCRLQHRSAKIRGTQIRAGQIRIGKVCFVQDCQAQLCASEISITCVGVFQSCRKEMESSCP